MKNLFLAITLALTAAQGHAAGEAQPADPILGCERSQPTLHVKEEALDRPTVFATAERRTCQHKSGNISESITLRLALPGSEGDAYSVAVSESDSGRLLQLGSTGIENGGPVIRINHGEVTTRILAGKAVTVQFVQMNDPFGFSTRSVSLSMVQN